jgi:hypothetical protein
MYGGSRLKRNKDQMYRTATLPVFIIIIQGDSNMTGTNCDLFTHKSSRSYLNHLVLDEKLEHVQWKRVALRQNRVFHSWQC